MGNSHIPRLEGWGNDSRKYADKCAIGTAGIEAFAPGPNDFRWPAILAERPDLAPALESPFRGVANGGPSDLDRALSNRIKRLKALGNAVVPQCAEWIGHRILAFEESAKR
jgi:site-specific DNA-cytosine methylase